MSGAGFILAINLFVAGLLSAAFMMIAVYDRSRVAARWLALGYAVGMGFFAIEAVIPALGNARLAVVAAGRDCVRVSLRNGQSWLSLTTIR